MALDWVVSILDRPNLCDAHTVIADFHQKQMDINLDLTTLQPLRKAREKNCRQLPLYLGPPMPIKAITVAEVIASQDLPGRDRPPEKLLNHPNWIWTVWRQNYWISFKKLVRWGTFLKSFHSPIFLDLPRLTVAPAHLREPLSGAHNPRMQPEGPMPLLLPVWHREIRLNFWHLFGILAPSLRSKNYVLPALNLRLLIQQQLQLEAPHLRGPRLQLNCTIL